VFDRRGMSDPSSGEVSAGSMFATGDSDDHDRREDHKCKDQCDLHPCRPRGRPLCAVRHGISSLALGIAQPSLRDIMSLSNTLCILREMPKLWADTVETHRHEVREAIQETTIALVVNQGLRSVTMSQIAERTGIGRATLYKYFPDVDSILRAWHERQIHSHLHELVEAAERATDPLDRLTAVLHSYALIVHGSRGHRDTELAALLHGHHARHNHAEQQLQRMVRTLIGDAVTMGSVRSDVSPEELTEYCLHALTASRSLASKAAVGRLVGVILAGLAPENHKKPTL